MTRKIANTMPATAKAKLKMRAVSSGAIEQLSRKETLRAIKSQSERNATVIEKAGQLYSFSDNQMYGDDTADINL